MINISIIGGGIGGLTAAIALTKKNFNVCVYERDQTPRVIGAGIVLWPNASYILNKLDLMSVMIEKCHRLTSLNTFNQNNMLLTHIPRI